MSGEIQHRPPVLDLDPVSMNDEGRTGLELSVMVFQLMTWSYHLEKRLAKYETFAPSPKPGATIVTKHTAFDPDRRPLQMVNLDTASLNEVPNSLEVYASGYTRVGAIGGVRALYAWAKHLESVREGLQAQLNKYERQERQRLESELATREAGQRDRSSDH